MTKLRNMEPLTILQKGEVRIAARELGIDSKDIVFYSGPSVYSDLLDKILIGPNIFPATFMPVNVRHTMLERLSMKAALAHELAHALTTRMKKSFEPGSVIDEFQASVFAARKVLGLIENEQCQLLGDAVERTKARGGDPKQLKKQIYY